MIDELTELVFLLDESGSMQPYTDGTLECVNRVIDEHREQNKKIQVTVAAFSIKYKSLYNNLDIKYMVPLTREDYHPEGGTALLDAIGITLTSVMLYYETIHKNNRPQKVNVIVTILTDGEENSSHLYDFNQIKKMIETYENKCSWKIVFIGADIDAIAEAAKLNIEASRTYQVDRSDSNWVSNCACVMCEAIDD